MKRCLASRFTASLGHQSLGHSTCTPSLYQPTCTHLVLPYETDRKSCGMEPEVLRNEPDVLPVFYYNDALLSNIGDTIGSLAEHSVTDLKGLLRTPLTS